MELQINPTSDADLLRAYVQEKSEPAFTQLVDRYLNLVYSTALRRVGNRHLAEDVTQAVFLVLARKANRLQHEQVLAGWLFRTAKFISADAVKMRRRRLHHERNQAVNQVLTRDAALDSEIFLHLETAMDRLPAVDRDAILLRYFQDLTVSEVAKQLRLADNTAAKRLGRALDRLRSNMMDLGINIPLVSIGTALSVTVHAAPAALAVQCQPEAMLANSAAVALATRAMRMNWFFPATALIVIVVIAIALAGERHPSGSPKVPVIPAPMIVADTTQNSQLQPQLPAQTLQIQAAICTLRHFHPWVQSTQWMTAIRTLVQIGSPAVPEMVAELDRTNKDSTFRAIAFALRAIDDARACPALIRASRRSNQIASSLGLKLVDPQLTKFMQENQIHPDAGGKYITLDTADAEIQAALESCAGRIEGKRFRFHGGEVGDVEMAASLKRQKELADAWQKWWDVHQADLVSDADMATLTQQPHTVEAVEAAGLAVNGPMFPTGHSYHLGPVHDLWLSVLAENYDSESLISFDRQQALSLLDCVRLLPADKKITGTWYLDPPVAIDAACAQYQIPTGPTRPAFAPLPHIVVDTTGWKKYFTLNAYSVAIWPTDNAMWDTLDKSIQAGSPISLDPNGPYSEFKSQHDKNSTDISSYPATFLIRTDRGGAGIVQFVETSDTAGSVHIRYRMIEPSPRPIPKVQMAEISTGASFTADREFVLPAPISEALCAFNLTKATAIAAPKMDDPGVHREQWLKQVDADVVTTHFYKTQTLAGLVFRDAVTIPLSSKQFQTMTADMAQFLLNHKPPLTDTGGGDFLSERFENPDPATELFRTGDGTAGMIQLLNIKNDEPRSVRFRYKLLQTTAAGN